MPDIKIKDPTILKQLETETKVSDPNLLQQLNSNADNTNNTVSDSPDKEEVQTEEATTQSEPIIPKILTPADQQNLLNGLNPLIKDKLTELTQYTPEKIQSSLSQIGVPQEQIDKAISYKNAVDANNIVAVAQLPILKITAPSEVKQGSFADVINKGNIGTEPTFGVSKSTKDETDQTGLKLAQSYAANGKYDYARSLSQSIADNSPENDNYVDYAKRLGGYSLNKQGDYENAAKSYDLIKNKTLDDFNNAATNKIIIGKIPEALQDISNVEQADSEQYENIPAKIRAKQLLGNIAYDAGDTETIDKLSNDIKGLKAKKEYFDIMKGEENAIAMLKQPEKIAVEFLRAIPGFTGTLVGTVENVIKRSKDISEGNNIASNTIGLLGDFAGVTFAGMMQTPAQVAIFQGLPMISNAIESSIKDNPDILAKNQGIADKLMGYAFAPISSVMGTEGQDNFAANTYKLGDIVASMFMLGLGHSAYSKVFGKGKVTTPTPEQINKAVEEIKTKNPQLSSFITKVLENKTPSKEELNYVFEEINKVIESPEVKAQFEEISNKAEEQQPKPIQEPLQETTPVIEPIEAVKVESTELTPEIVQENIVKDINDTQPVATDVNEAITNTEANISGQDVKIDKVVTETPTVAETTQVTEKPFAERTDTEHATIIKDKFTSEFKKQGLSDEQVTASIALMEARAKASGKGDAWYRQIEDIGNGEFQNKSNTLFQIIGEKGAKFKQDVIDNLYVAKQMESEGKTPKEIFMTTGWEKGVDGKWKVELDDKNANVLFPIDSIINDAQKKGTDYTKGEKTIMPLESIFDNAELFKAYPFLKEVKVVIEDMGKSDYAGGVSPEGNIHFNSNSPLNKIETKSNLIHEIQHIIQKEEGFAKGIIPDDARRTIIEKEFPELPHDISVEELYNRLSPMERKKVEKDAYAFYKRTAGEVEARNVQRRDVANIDKTKPFSSTEDVAQAEQEVLFQKGVEGQPKGATEILESGRKIIHAFKGADFSTAVHEIAYVFESEISAAEKTIVQEWAKTKEWTTKTSEAFARGFERYLKEGIAPTKELKTIFEKAKVWLGEIYTKLKGSAIEKKITPEVKAVFDNLFKEKTEVVKGKEITPAPEVKTEINKTVKNVNVSDVNTDVKRFQNREGEFSERSVKNITEQYDKNKLDPIVAWKDKDGKVYVLSGHSRLEAMKRMGEEKIPVRFFEGTEADAKKYAIDSNVLGTQESLSERANKYRKMREDGKSITEIEKEADIEGKNKRRVIDYSHLNPKGKTATAIKAFEETGVSENVDNIQRVGEWIGGAKRSFKELTDAHENEMYDYLVNKDKIGKKVGQINSKAEFYDLINRRVSGFEKFNAEEPLNFEHKVGKGSNQIEIENDIKNLKSQQTKITNEIKKTQKTVKDKKERDTKISQLNKEYLNIQKKIGDAEKKIETAIEGDKQQYSIFEQLNKEIENGNTDRSTVDEFQNRTADEVGKLEPVVKAIELKAESTKDAELVNAIKEADAEIKKIQERTDSGRVADRGGEPTANVEAAKTTETAKDITKPTFTEQGKKIADNIRKGKLDKDITLAGIPFAKEVWNGAVESVASAVEVGGKLSDAIEKGVNLIKESEWYKSLTADKQAVAEQKFRDEFKTEGEAKGNVSKEVSSLKKSMLVTAEETLKYSSPKGLTAEGIFQKATNDYIADKEGKVKEIKDIVNRLNTDEFASTNSYEKALLLIHQAELKSDITSKLESVEAEKNPLMKQQIQSEISVLENEYQDYKQAVLKGVTREWGIGGQLMQMVVDKDLNIIEERAKINAINTKGKYVKDILTQLNKLVKDHDELQSKYESLLKKKYESGKKILTTDLEKAAKKYVKSNTFRELIGKAEGGIDKLIEQTRKDILMTGAGQMSVNALPLQLANMAKLVSLYVAKGGLKLVDAVAKVHDEFKDKFTDLKKEDIEKAFSDEIERLDKETAKQASDELTKALLEKRDKLQKNLDDRNFAEKKRKDKVLNEEQASIKKDIDKLNKQIAEEKRKEQRGGKTTRLVALEKKLEEKQATVEDLKNGIISEKGEKKIFKPLTSEEKLVGEKIDDINKLIDKLTKEVKSPKSVMETRQRASLSGLLRENIKLDKKLHELSDNTYKETKREPIEQNKEILNVKDQIEKKREKVKELQWKAKMRNMDKYDKAMYYAGKTYRASILAGAKIVGKLTAVVAHNIYFKPVEHLAGEGLAKIFTKQYINDPVNFPIGFKEAIKLETGLRKSKGFESKLLGEKVGGVLPYMFEKYGKQWKDILSTGKSTIERIYGKKSKEYDSYERLLDVYGAIHAALKEPVKRAGFIRTLRHAEAWAEYHGIDLSDPINAAIVGEIALKGGKRYILMNDNIIAESINNIIYALENSKLKDKAGQLLYNKGVDVSRKGMKAAALGLRMTFPIVKIPTNFVGETLHRTFAVFPAVGKTIEGYGAEAVKNAPEPVKQLVLKIFPNIIKKAISNLTPEQATRLSRNQIYGATGATLFALGFYNAEHFGGYYRVGIKKKEDDLDWGETEIFGMKIPKWMSYFPPIIVMHFGATMRNILDAREKAITKKGEEYGTMDVVGGVAKGIATATESAPLMSGTRNIKQTMTTGDIEPLLGNLAAGFIPQFIKEIAKTGDEKDVKYKTEEFMDYIQAGIPGWRQMLPEKGGSTSGSMSGTGEPQQPTEPQYLGTKKKKKKKW